MYVRQVQCVVLYSAHMFNQDEGFVDSNLTLCDLQISEEERFVRWNVRQVFVWMWREVQREIYIFLLVETTVGRDSAEYD